MTLEQNAKRFGMILAIALLALLPAAALMAQDEDMPAADEEITLTGQLSFDDDMGYFMLIEEESGDAITLNGSVDFAQFFDAKVNVTGKWVEADDGSLYFEVSQIEAAE